MECSECKRDTRKGDHSATCSQRVRYGWRGVVGGIWDSSILSMTLVAVLVILGHTAWKLYRGPVDQNTVVYLTSTGVVEVVQNGVTVCSVSRSHIVQCSHKDLAIRALASAIRDAGVKSVAGSH